jgi:hypothetical protein
MFLFMVGREIHHGPVPHAGRHPLDEATHD